MKRPTISKSVRFDIFRRDKFTCVYCGKKPPEVRLVLDHVIPVAAGGATDKDNLCTSCEECNAGKSDKVLSEYAPGTLDRLAETQERLEEIAAMRDQAKLSAILRDEQDKLRAEIVDHWFAEFGYEPMPSTVAMCLNRLEFIDVEKMKEFITRCALKGCGSKTQSARYLGGIFRRHLEEQGITL